MPPSRHQVVLVALGVVPLLDVPRVFLPSLITLFGRAGSTAPEPMGLCTASAGVSAGPVFLSAGAPRRPFSDHLPVVATLRLTSVDQQG